VTNDTEAIREKITAFVDAYNAVVTLVSENTAYNSETQDRKRLPGEATARDIVKPAAGDHRSRVSGLPEELRNLSQIGISTESDGTLKIDADALAGKLAEDLNGVSDLFNAEGGIADQLYDYVDGVTDSISGAITYRTKSLESIVRDISDEIDAAEARPRREGREPDQAVRQARSAHERLFHAGVVPFRPAHDIRVTGRAQGIDGSLTIHRGCTYAAVRCIQESGG
jgi:flagellar capping protein FliD